MTDPVADLKNIKEKLIEQISSQYPADKADNIISTIKAMNDEEFLAFLKEQGMIGGENQKCIFCSMIEGEIPTTKVGENEKAIAILEINPVSKGHTMIIPKEHISSRDKVPKELKELAEVISIKLKTLFGAKNVLIEPGNVTGHEMLNVVPVYENETLQSPRKKETPEGLQKVKEELDSLKIIKQEEKKEEKPKEEEKPEVISDKTHIIPKRIP